MKRIRDERLKQLHDIVRARMDRAGESGLPCLVHLHAPEVMELLAELRDRRIDAGNRLCCAVCGHEFSAGEIAGFTSRGRPVCFRPGAECYERGD